VPTVDQRNKEQVAARVFKRGQGRLGPFEQLAVGINQGEVNVNEYVRVLHALYAVPLCACRIIS